MNVNRTAAAAIPMALAIAVSALAPSIVAAQGGFGRAFSGVNGPDPMVSDISGLLQRPEVQNEISLDMRQRNALDQAANDIQANQQQQTQQALQNVNRGSLRNMTPEQRQQAMQELQAKLQAARQASLNFTEEELKRVLKPAQLARLHQIDLQRRGPMSMADAKVAEEVKLSPDHRAAASKVLADYRQQTQAVVQDAFNDMRQELDRLRQNGQLQAGQAPPMPDFSSRQSPYRRKLDAIRKQSEDAALAAISPDELAAWKAAIGAPFHFRPDPPFQPGFGGPGALPPPAPGR